MKSRDLFIIIVILVSVIYLILSNQEVWLIPLIVCLVVISLIGKRFQKFFESSLWKAILLIMLIISVFEIGSYILITKVFGVQSLFWLISNWNIRNLYITESYYRWYCDFTIKFSLVRINFDWHQVFIFIILHLIHPHWQKSLSCWNKS